MDGISPYDLPERTRQAYIFGQDADDETCGVFVRYLQGGGVLTGAIGFEGLPSSETLSPTIPVLAAVALECAHAFSVNTSTLKIAYRI